MESALIVTDIFSFYENSASASADYSDAIAQLEVHFTAFTDTLAMYFTVRTFFTLSFPIISVILNLRLDLRLSLSRGLTRSLIED
jgi:hypothetical protein